MNIQEIKNKATTHVVTHKKKWIIGLIILICLLIVTGFALRHKRASKEPQLPEGLVECAPGDKYSIRTGEPCPLPEEVENTTGESVNTDPMVNPNDTLGGDADATVKPASSYELAREEYKGKVLSYNAMCQATPGELGTTPDSVVMIANDGTKTHTFTLAGKTTTLVPYHYDLIYIGSANTYKVTCDGADAGSVVAK